ncbi:MAG: hypothetical protein CW338_06670 [Clostridiales bacterium]|nr:hypothetical protein [Clostridiales bacterium]
MMYSTSSRRGRAHFDWPIVLLVYAISLFGIFCISVAMYNPETGQNLSALGRILDSRSGQMQCIWVFISPFVLGFIYAIPPERMRALSRLIFFLIFILLSVTLFLSKAVNGINSWLSTGFGRSIQPCEFAKISTILILAKQLTKTDKPMGTAKSFFITLATVGLPALIVLLQGETGSVIVIAAVFLTMTFFAKVDMRLWLTMVAIAAIGIAILITYGILSGTDDYRILRLLAFTDPSKYSESGGYQLLQAQNAIGSGQINGIGVYRSDAMSTLGYVPESSTDFIFSVVGESFGFIGSSALILAYLILLIRIAVLGRYTYDAYGRLLIYGVLGMLLFHVFENIAMCIGLMPITGIPLPFMSYGGSNYLTNMMGIGLVLSAVKHRSNTAPVDPQSGGWQLSGALTRSQKKESRLRKLIPKRWRKKKD